MNHFLRFFLHAHTRTRTRSVVRPLAFARVCCIIVVAVNTRSSFAAPPVRPVPKPKFSTEAQAAIKQFCAGLPDARTAQNAVIRSFVLREGVRPEPQFPSGSLLAFLDARAEAATTPLQKRETMQDFLLIARRFEKQSDTANHRRGMRAALKALELAGDDAGLRADIAGAFLAPFLLDADAAGDLGIAVLLGDLWVRYGRIVTLELQSEADIAAMQQKAQTNRVPSPPLQLEASSPLTVPFLTLLSRVPGERRGWAAYRLARLLRAQGNLKSAAQVLETLDYGDGAGVFRRLITFYQQPSNGGEFVLSPSPSSNDDSPLEGEGLRAWKKLRELLPPDVAKAQSELLADLRSASQKAPDEKRRTLYNNWAQGLEALRETGEQGMKERRRLVRGAVEVHRKAFMALLQADGAQNVYYFRSLPDLSLLSRTNEAFILPYFEALSGIGYNAESRYDVIRSISPDAARAGMSLFALRSVEVFAALAGYENHYSQALDVEADLLEKAGRFEDALLCLEAIPESSGMSGGRVWKAPRLRRALAEQAKRADKSAVITVRETPEGGEPK